MSEAEPTRTTEEEPVPILGNEPIVGSTSIWDFDPTNPEVPLPAEDDDLQEASVAENETAGSFWNDTDEKGRRPPSFWEL